MGSEKLLFRLEQPHGNGNIYIAWQKGSGNYLATTGTDSIVNIFDRHGQIHERIKLQSWCSGFAWDSDGDLLAMICQSQLFLWDANTSKKQAIDVGLRDVLTCLLWSKTAPVLAIGTAKGNLSIYNHNTSKRTPVIGKHTKKITCGSWSTENLIAVGSEDKLITVSNSDGDTLRTIALRAEPAEIQFSEMKMDERVGTENTISVIVGKRTLYLYNLLDPENPIELAFQHHYGAIVTYKWFGDGYILLGFASGYFIAISTHIKEVGQELFQVKNHKNTLTGITICSAIGKAASCGDNNVKIHDLSNLQETSNVITLPQETGVDSVEWSADGQLLAVCTNSGSLNVFVSNMPTLTAVCGSRIAILSSLMEASVYNYTPDKTKLIPIPINLEVEPTFLAVSQFHLAAGMNNRAWFYDLTRPQPGCENAPLMLKDRQYLGGVDSIKLNPEYASVLFEGKIQLHMIEQPEAIHEERESKIFPEADFANKFITCHCLTTDFLVYATDMGDIVYFHVEEWAVAVEYKHTVGINKIFVDSAGSRLVFFDVKSQGYLFDAVTNEVFTIPGLPNKIVGVTWDNNLSDRDVFIVYDEHDIFTYIYVKYSIYGASIQKIGNTSLVSKQIPLLMHAGEVISAAAGGLTQLNLSTHDSILLGIGDKDRSILELNFNKQVALHRFKSAFETCKLLKSKSNWEKLAKECMKHLEVEIALRVFEELGDVATAWSLNDLIHIDDYKLLSGYMALFLGEFERAQTSFLNSSRPTAALEMRCDLLQWDQGLQLAKRMAPEMVGFISKEYAQQLEFMGNYSEAYVHYEKALQENPKDANQVLLCKSGIARAAMFSGNYRHGINTAIELNSKQLFKECAEILEKKKQHAEAASFYEKAENYDKAASLYIKLKDWQKVGRLLGGITSNKLHLQYAKAKESEGKYEEAVRAYSAAKDYDSVIRLNLDYLNSPEVAVELVQETKSVEGAKMVSRFFQRLNDYSSAIKFLVLANCQAEAFDLAQKYGKLELYGEILLDTMTPDELKTEDFINLAVHFEERGNNLLAGKYWFHAKEYEKSMKHLFKAAKSNVYENEAITTAIDVVASSHDARLEKQLIDFLLGETDAMPKDPKYLFRLYMARKQYKEAAKSAVIIANEEQINGNYRNAHDVLFGMYQELRQNDIKVPREMQYNLMLLHSYILVRLHVRRGDHMKGARLLMRVANNISSFPSHTVPILTSAVIECHRAGLKYAAFKYATLLMKPEYRKNIDAKYAKKIEAVVRKPPKNGKVGEAQGDPPEVSTPCPYCEKLLPETELVCNVCTRNIPFCIVTGRHVIKSDLTTCPECGFLAIYSEFLEILQTENSCPMCAEKLEPQRLIKIQDTKMYLQQE